MNSDLTSSAPPKRQCILVCQHRSCLRNGSEAVLAAFQQASAPGVFVSGSDCMGQCTAGPTVRVMPDGTWYCRIRPSDAPIIIEQHLQSGQPVQALLHPRFHPRDDAFPASLDNGS